LPSILKFVKLIGEPVIDERIPMMYVDKGKLLTGGSQDTDIESEVIALLLAPDNKRVGTDG